MQQNSVGRIARAILSPADSTEYEKSWFLVVVTADIQKNIFDADVWSTQSLRETFWKRSLLGNPSILFWRSEVTLRSNTDNLIV